VQRSFAFFVIKLCKLLQHAPDNCVTVKLKKLEIQRNTQMSQQCMETL